MSILSFPDKKSWLFATTFPLLCALLLVRPAVPRCVAAAANAQIDISGDPSPDSSAAAAAAAAQQRGLQR